MAKEIEIKMENTIEKNITLNTAIIDDEYCRDKYNFVKALGSDTLKPKVYLSSYSFFQMLLSIIHLRNQIHLPSYHNDNFFVIFEKDLVLVHHSF